MRNRMRPNLRRGVRSVPRYAVLLGWVAVVIVPLSVVILGAFKQAREIFETPFALPKTPTFESFREVIVTGNMLVYYRNTILVAGVSIAVLVVCAALIAYAVTRRTYRPANTIYYFFVFGMTIPVQSIMVPSYLLMSTLGLVDNPLSLILVYISSLMPFSVFIVSGFFRTIPGELEESAKIDGASDLATCTLIYVPLARSAIASIVIFNVLTIWNDFYNPLLYIRSERFKTVTLGLLRHVGQYSSNYPRMFAAVLIASVPVIIVFLLLQRRFEEGITAGALKG